MESNKCKLVLEYLKVEGNSTRGHRHTRNIGRRSAICGFILRNAKRKGRNSFRPAFKSGGNPGLPGEKGPAYL